MAGSRKCYASQLGNCKGGLSREHYISEALLVELGREIRFAGFPWMKPGESQTLTPSALKARILCRTHNSALSKLDSEIRHFFRALRHASGPNKVFLEDTFQGEVIERWMLKAIAGMCASRVARMSPDKRIDWAPPISWLQTIFDEAPLSSGQGLFIEVAVGQQIRSVAGFGLAPLLRIGSDEVIGGDIELAGYHFLIALDQVPSCQDAEGVFRNALYRPKEMRLPSGRIKLKWKSRDMAGLPTKITHGN